MSGPIPPSNRPVAGTGPVTENASSISTEGSDGKRDIRKQTDASHSLKPSTLTFDHAKKSIDQRTVSKVHPGNSPATKKTPTVKNLPKTLAVLQNTINKLSVPGYRKSKNDALLESIKIIKAAVGKLGNPGNDLILKKALSDLLTTTVIDGPTRMTMADAGNISRIAGAVLDAPTRTKMEQQVAGLLNNAKSALWLHAGTTRKEPVPNSGNTRDYHRCSVTEDENYSPKDFTSKRILDNESKGEFIGDNGRYADNSDVSTIKSWNAGYKRSSHAGPITFDGRGRPLNPTGATGIEGRGELGLWGPNHAADNIITRTNGQNELEVLLIQRKDTGQWALPGGMVEGEKDILNVALKELAEEALVIGDEQGGKDLSKEAIQNKMEELKQYECFKSADNTYKGVVNDPRNTDNAWMETEAWAVHLSPEVVSKIRIQAGDDASAARWIPVTKDNLDNLYASHSQIVRTAPVIKQALESHVESAPTIEPLLVKTPTDSENNPSSIPKAPPPPPLPEEKKTVANDTSKATKTENRPPEKGSLEDRSELFAAIRSGVTLKPTSKKSTETSKTDPVSMKSQSEKVNQTAPQDNMTSLLEELRQKIPERRDAMGENNNNDDDNNNNWDKAD